MKNQRKIYIRLAGGLGNQIFQIGASLLIAKKFKHTKLYLEINSLNQYTQKRNLELFKIFNIKKLEEIGVMPYITKNNIFAISRLPKIFSINKKNWPFLNDINFKNNLNNSNNFIIMDGYFQNCITQDNFIDEINILKKILFDNSYEFVYDECVIHVRGRDFIKLGWNNICNMQYYQKAIAIMNKQYNIKKYYIVTDDINYSEYILKKFKIEYEYYNSSSVEDFLFIGRCKYRILSNSTFAFWASALGNNENNFVVAPRYWIPGVERKIYLKNEISLI